MAPTPRWDCSDLLPADGTPRLYSHGKLGGRLKKSSPWHKINRSITTLASKPTLLHKDKKNQAEQQLQSPTQA